MERIGNILDMVLSPALVGEAVEYSRLYKAWNSIIDDAFMSWRAGDEEAEDFVFDDAETKNRVNAAKLHDHSRVRELDRQRLVIETDHPGWIQILQFRQQQLLTAAQRKFPSLGIKKISFILMKAGGAR
jgi:serine phosphatase RsbU (regulator of sigma subunit)